MRYVPMLLILLAPGALAAQPAEPAQGVAAPAEKAAPDGSWWGVSVQLDVPHFDRVKVTRLWDGFNNCVYQDGTELTKSYPDKTFTIGANTHRDGTCQFEKSRMHWKLEFLPEGSVSGFAEIGFEQTEFGTVSKPTISSFCNVRNATDAPNVACLTGRQDISEPIRIGIVRPPSEVRTMLRVDYQGSHGRASGVKVTPLLEKGDDCFYKDGSATKIDKTSSSSIPLKAMLRGDPDCQNSARIAWRVDFLSTEAFPTYAQITLEGSQKPGGYSVICREWDISGGAPRNPPLGARCTATSRNAEYGIDVSLF